MADRRLLEGGAGFRLLESGAGVRLLETAPAYLTPTLVQQQFASNTSTSSISLTLPAAPTVGNILIGYCTTNDGDDFTVPTGFTTAANNYNATDDDRHKIFYRVVQTGDGTSYTCSGFTGNSKLFRLQEYSNVDLVTPVDTGNTVTSSTSTAATSKATGTTGTLTLPVNLAFTICTVRAAITSESVGSGFTKQATDNNGASFYNVFSTLITSTTTALNPTVSWTTAGDAWASMVIFRAAAGGGGGGALEMVADPASYTVSASAATLAKAGNISADPAVYVYSAQAAQLVAGRAVSANPAAFSVSAAPATLLRTYAFPADPAAYTLTAAPATLATARAVSADPATYAVTAQAATLTADRALLADPAVFTVSAFDADLAAATSAITLDAQPAAYAVSAQAATLAATKALNAQAASYAVTADATLSADRVLAAIAATYSLTAAPAGVAATKAINAAAASYVVSASDATLTPAGGTDVLTSTDLANITAIVDARVAELQKIWLNKMTTDPATGLLTIYDDDNTTPLWQGPIYEDVAGTQPYRDKGADRRDKLT